MAPVLGYWKIRGLGAAVRLLAAHAGAELDEALYEVPASDPKDRSAWTDVKETLELDFPNLPYYIDAEEGVSLTQSLAILTFVAAKHGYEPGTAAARARVDMLLGAAMDLSNFFTRWCYGTYAPEAHGEYARRVTPMLQRFEGALGDQRWFAGERITAADFLLYHLLEAHLIYEPELFDALPRLRAFIDRFEAEDRLRAYITTDAYIVRARPARPSRLCRSGRASERRSPAVPLTRRHPCACRDRSPPSPRPAALAAEQHVRKVGRLPAGVPAAAARAPQGREVSEASKQRARARAPPLSILARERALALPVCS